MNSQRLSGGGPDRVVRRLPDEHLVQSHLVGRSAELSVVADLVARIAGGGGAVIVRGDPGIGKSQLLRRAAEMAGDAGCTVLAVTGLESAAAPPFSGLGELMGPLLPDAGDVPPVQLSSLLTACGVAQGPPPEVFLVALAALTLLTERAASGPVVIIADDMQWLDSRTNEVLAFLARRIGDDAIAVIGAVRPGYSIGLSDADCHLMELHGLDDVSSRMLLAAGPPLTPGDRDTILQAAMGNPLALTELPLVWKSGELGYRWQPESVPLTARLERAFAARITHLPPVTRDAILVAAVNRGAELAEIVAGTSLLSGQSVTAAVLEPAERAGILRFDEANVQFRHPLVRSGVLLHEPVARRQAANAALSAVFPVQSPRRTWHRSQAVDGPADDIADALELDQHESVRRGALMEAISALERAAQLTSDPATQGQRLLLAAHHAYGLGRADLVDRFVTAAAQTAFTALDRARVEWLREIFDDGEPGDADRILALCETAVRAQVAGDPDLALNLVLSAAGRCWWADTGAQPRARVVQVADSLIDSQDDPRCLAAVAVAEPILRGTQVITRLSGFSPETVVDADHLRLLGMAARAVGDETRAADFLDRAEARLRVQGQLGLLSHVLGLQGAVQVDLGDWHRAFGSAEEAYRLGEETGQPVWASGAAVLGARAAALRGDIGQALEQAAEVEKSTTMRRINQFLACAQLARGIAEICAGRHADAYDALRPLFDPGDPRHHQREQLSGIMYLAEAAVGCDRREEAKDILSRMEALACVTASPVLAMQLLYARPVLAADDDAEALYRDGLSNDLTRWPWIRSRIQLAYGMWLRRRRRRSESREPLRLALATFELIGAATWAGQARAELRAAGERTDLPEQGLSAELSAQELQVARLAAEGLSNREIGQRLFLSPRTVGSHLYRIFPRLGIRSRGQLAMLFGATPGSMADAAGDSLSWADR